MMDHPLKSFGTIFLTVFLFFGKSLAFETWSLPVESSLKTLRVTNLSSQPQAFWLMGPRDPQKEAVERNYQIQAFATEEIPLIEFQELDWLRLLAEKEKVFQIQVDTRLETRVLLNSGSHTRWKVRSRPQAELVIFNQAPFEQTVQITAPGEAPWTVKLASLGKQHLPLSPQLSGSMLTISGEARIGGFLLSEQGPRAWIPDPAPVQLQTPTEPVYFQLTNRNASQSYLVALTNTEQIDQARKQIEKPDLFLPRILIAKIDYGHGQFNRDFTVSNRPPWSWHINQVLRFAEFASQECDGSPELLEETLGPWMQNSGVICFWNYRVVRELSAEQVAKGQVP